MIRQIVTKLFIGVVITSLWTTVAPPLSAQATERAKQPASGAVTGDSVTIADVERAAEQLAVAVEVAVRRATEDPAVKVAALKVAKNAVTAAQVVMTQQAQTIQTVLDALAREIALATEKQKTRNP